jgi:hypothetical protein
MPKTMDRLTSPAQAPRLPPPFTSGSDGSPRACRSSCRVRSRSASLDAILDACCAAWNQLTQERLRSLTNYPYLERVIC